MSAMIHNKSRQPQTGPSATEEWWRQGVRFQCQGSGKCCTSHGEYGYVFLTLEDRRRMAKHLGLTTSVFTKKYCIRLVAGNGKSVWHLHENNKNPDCMFLRGKACSIYEARPTQCRTWPFWPEVMNPKIWKKEVVSFCPGIGRGPVVDGNEIERQLAIQKKAEESITQ